MVKSMTGFGKKVCTAGNTRITIEIRTLNSRQMDINLKIPSVYREWEPQLRKTVTDNLQRGKADITIQVDQAGADFVPVVNREAVSHYYKEINETVSELGLKDPGSHEIMKLAFRMPDILAHNRPEPDEDQWNQVYQGFLEALDQTDIHRTKEGQAMQADLVKRIAEIEKCLSGIEKFEKERVENIRNRLRQNLNEFFSNNNVDRNRFEQEIIYYLEKLDITEEKVRLNNHISYFRETLSGNEPPGKKLGFICQEIGREINTIGSKANDFNIQKLVVLMKDELEKIKEQSLNIL